MPSAPATQHLAHAAGNDRRVGGLAAARGQDALGSEEAVDVFRLGLFTHQDDLEPLLLAEHLGTIGVEHRDAGGGAGGGRQTGGHGRHLGLEVQAREDEQDDLQRPQTQAVVMVRLLAVEVQCENPSTMRSGILCSRMVVFLGKLNNEAVD
jgi:hypothetical protein